MGVTSRMLPKSDRIKGIIVYMVRVSEHAKIFDEIHYSLLFADNVYNVLFANLSHYPLHRNPFKTSNSQHCYKYDPNIRGSCNIIKV